MHHIINKHFASELILSYTCCACVLILLHIKLFDIIQLILLDVLYHYKNMVDFLHSQKKWCTNINAFNILHRQNIFLCTDPILLFVSHNKLPLFACSCKIHIQSLFSFTKALWMYLSRQKSFVMILVLALA